jgi:hypothetical protein
VTRGYALLYFAADLPLLNFRRRRPLVALGAQSEVSAMAAASVIAVY